MFVNRQKEIQRIETALLRQQSQLIVVYGRRRCGKSTLLQHVMPESAIYYSADKRVSHLQINALARQIETQIPGFSKPVYPDWESVFTSFNTALKSRATLCIDEFPYLVKNSPELPSVIQNLIDQNHNSNFHLILCGSSQQMMYSMTLDKTSPLYGRSDEIIRVKPLSLGSMNAYFKLSPLEIVYEYGVWGGVPRYWEIRKQAEGFAEAIKTNLLDQNGILNEEPERLFSDELRTSVQAFSILSLIGAGVHRLSELAGRIGKPATQLSRTLGFLINQGYIKREIPYGESEKSTKRTLYKIDDPFMKFYFTFLVPNKSRLDFDLIDKVWDDIENKIDPYVSDIWEEVCRNVVPRLEIDGNRFSPASRWWGNGLDGKPMEIDIVANSLDNKALLVAEVKWSEKISIRQTEELLDAKSLNLPIKGRKKIIKAVFVKKRNGEIKSEIKILTPDDVVGLLR